MDTDLKKCTKCKELKEKNDFCKYKRNKDGLNHTCKGCVKTYQDENSERIGKVNKKYKQDNKEKIEQYREDNKDKAREYQKQYWTPYYEKK